MNFSDLDDAIIFEDEALVVLNKPAGWVVNRAVSYKDVTVQDWWEGKIQGTGRRAPPPQRGRQGTAKEDGEGTSPYGTPEEIFAQRGGIVHRLDKDTSGILLLAKTPEVLVELLRQFRERQVQKTYTALVHGKVQPSEGVIRLPMERSSTDYKKFAVSVDGKLSETAYRVLEFFPGLPTGISAKKGKGYQGFTLLELKPKTGRTHQIRVHLSTIKHPIVGDGTYAGRKRIAVDQEWCPRQFLHAAQLTCTHPRTHEEMTFVAPLAEDLQNVLNDHFIHIASPKE